MLEVLIAGEHRGRGPRAPAGQTRVAVRAVAHQRQPIGNRDGRHAELLPHPRFVPHLARAPIELNDTVAPHALRQILVGRAHDDLLDARIGGGHRSGGGQRIVGLELDHGPNDDAERAQRLLERLELAVQQRVDALARLVVRPERVAERFDDVIGGHSHVRGAAFEHAENGSDDTTDRPELRRRAPVERRRGREEVAEQLVRPVDEMNDHDQNHTPGAPPKETGTHLGSRTQ